MIKSLLKQVAPHMSDDQVQVTRDKENWYRLIGGKLFIPPMSVLTSNIVELVRFIDVVKVFQVEEGAREGLFAWGDANLELLEIDAELYGYEASVQSIKDLHEDIKVVGKGVVAVDIETCNVNWEGNRVLCIGFAYNMNKCASIWWAPELVPYIQEILLDPGITFIWHNGKFDCGRLKFLENVDARVDEDTMLMHYACINERRGTHGLKTLGPLYLQAPQWDDELDRHIKEYARANKCPLRTFSYDMLPKRILVPYMQRDCIATLRLYHLFNLLRVKGTEQVYSWLVRGSNVFKDIEMEGFKVDLEYLEELEWKLEQDLTKATQVFNDEVARVWDPIRYVEETGSKSFPSYFNIKSNPQLKWVLETVTGRTLTSTDAETLKFLTEEYPNLPFIQALQEVRKLSKQIDTYVIGLRERLCTDLRVRGTYNLHGTETGRLSSSDPNMQNIPRDALIKNLFISSPGKILLQLDYSQAELRVLAHLAKDKFMTKLYQEDRDLHTEVTIAVHGPKEQWPGGKEARSWIKTIIFGAVYGRGPSTVATQLGISMSEAKDLIQKVFSYLSEGRDWIANRRVMATRGEDCVTIFGRHRHFIMTDSSALNHIQNEYINTPVQSVASDLTLVSLLNIHDKLKKEQSNFKIVATVHDSIILEGPDTQELHTVKDWCLDIMKNTPLQLMPDCEVPFKADAEWGYKWGEMQS